MDWIELVKENVVVITYLTGVLGYFASSFKSLRAEIKTSSDRHEARCDKLYEMFYDLIKESKKKDSNNES
jgi:hypothetical protein